MACLEVPVTSLVVALSVAACFTRHAPVTAAERAVSIARVVVKAADDSVVGVGRIDGLVVSDNVRISFTAEGVPEVSKLEFGAKLRGVLNGILERNGLAGIGRRDLSRALARGQLTCHTAGYDDPLYRNFIGVGSLRCSNALVYSLAAPPGGVPTTGTVGITKIDATEPRTLSVPADLREPRFAPALPRTATWEAVLPILQAALVMEESRQPPSEEYPDGSTRLYESICLANAASVLDAGGTDWGLAQAAIDAFRSFRRRHESRFFSHWKDGSIEGLWSDPCFRFEIDQSLDASGVEVEPAAAPCPDAEFASSRDGG